MRLRTTALVATAIAGLLYVSAPSASALPAASRADVTTSTTAKTAGVTEQVHYRRRGYRRYGYGYGYRPYGFYGGYGGYGYRPYYYRPYYYGGGYPYYYRRRPGFGIYFGF
jgi:hypothetical protein